MINKVGIIVHHAVGDERATMGIRTAYAAQAGGYPTSMVMTGPGVYCLMGAVPDYTRNMINLFLENEGRLACCSESLEARGISPSDLAFPGIEVVDQDGLGEITEDADSLNLF